MTVNVGDRVRDPITGLTGVVTARAIYMWGCVQVLVNPGLVKDGQIIDGTWLDENRVEIVPGPPPPCPGSTAGFRTSSPRPDAAAGDVTGGPPREPSPSKA